MTRVLVTGVSGLIGSHLTKKLLNRGDEVIGLHRSRSPGSNLRRMGLESDITEELVNVTDYGEVKELVAYYQPSTVVHLGAIAQVKKALSDPRSTYRVNLMGTVNLLEVVRNSRIDPNIVVASTDKTYGDKTEAAVDDKLEPTGPYETSKCCVDYAARSYIDTYGLNISIFRSCNCYGYESKGGRIVSNTIISCLEGENPIIFSNIEGIREYVYCEDLARAIISLFDAPPGVYNIATGNVFGQEEVVGMILEHFPNLEPEYVEKENPEEEIEAQSMIPSYFDDWEPEYSFEDGIGQTIEDFRRFGYVK